MIDLILWYRSLTLNALILVIYLVYKQSICDESKLKYVWMFISILILLFS